MKMCFKPYCSTCNLFGNMYFFFFPAYGLLSRRAYNPRLFRLQHKLDTTDEADTSREKAPDKPKETKRVGISFD